MKKRPEMKAGPLPDGGVWVERTSMMTGKPAIVKIPGITIQEFTACWEAWEDGALIQDAFPMMDADTREFLKTGLTPVEWDYMTKGDE